MNFRENFKKDMKKCEHHITDLRKQLASRHAAVEKVSGLGGRTCWERVGRLPRGRGGGQGAGSTSLQPRPGQRGREEPLPHGTRVTATGPVGDKVGLTQAHAPRRLVCWSTGPSPGLPGPILS